MQSTPQRSRLFHAVVLMGCALGGTAACASSNGGDAADGDGGCHVPDGGWPDGGAPSHEAGVCEDDAGWPPTK